MILRRKGGAATGEALDFDQQSGLLVRLVRYAESPVGLAPTRIDYGDYRETLEETRTPYVDSCSAGWEFDHPVGTGPAERTDR